MPARPASTAARTQDPSVAVVIATRFRETRLAFALEALAAQTLDRDRFEVIVVRASESADGALADVPPGLPVRYITCPVAGAAAQRNLGWRATDAPLVAFTDDDCRPAPDWLERLLASAGGPETIVQGATRPDPDEEHLLARAPHARTMRVEPPGPWGQTCNILYPRAVLERAGGFDERFAHAGEATALLQRALAVGARQVAAPGAVVLHAVETPALGEHLRSLRRWELVPAVVARHPQLRAGMPLRLFWKTRHATFTLALA